MPVTFLGDSDEGTSLSAHGPIEALQQWRWRRLLMRDIRRASPQKLALPPCENSSQISTVKHQLQPKLLATVAVLAFCLFLVAAFLVIREFDADHALQTSQVPRFASVSEPLADLQPPLDLGDKEPLSVPALVPISTSRKQPAESKIDSRPRPHRLSRSHKSHRHRLVLATKEDLEIARDTVRYYSAPRSRGPVAATTSNSTSARNTKPWVKKVTVIN